ncbi:putative bifunctional diguanylate cyclase/phosphodiesterase [Halothiobacillus sp.]|uniref:putative bifunctional diguanylate cyclase/phosphodiesterase n=1 Tax=Halothiobacillus sp. TaxID=1891311 RepID=UPI002AD270D6|nr:EAL domain-containing protein [Halothiobacillus sp.]
MSFRLKTIFGIAFIQAILLFAMIWNGIGILTTTNEQELLKRSSTTADLFSSSAQGGVLGMDLSALESLVKHMLTNPDVVYARVLNKQGITLVEGGDAQILVRRFVPDRTFTGVKDGIFDAGADIVVSGESYGRVEIGVSIKSIQASIKEARNQSFVFAGLVLGLVALFSSFLVIYLTRGLEALKVASQRIAAGDLGYQIAVSGTDELAQTARSFNDMSSQIRTSYDERRRAEDEVRKLNEVLEERVNQRTTQLSSLNEELEHRSFHDALTQIPNRVLFQDRLHQAGLMLRRNEEGFAVLQVDLDRFKAINDTLGHHVGDIVLQEVSGRMQATLRESDTVARMGGDEFALLLSGIDDAAGAAVVAQKIIDATAKPIVIGGHTLFVGASIGIALAPQDGDNGEDLMRRADAAMYEAKQTRGGYVFFREGLEQVAQERNQELSELRDALENDEMVLHYQPKIDFSSHVISGAEALIRWQHPTRGLVYPDDFIPLAEKSGLIKLLTTVVIKKALAQCAVWRAEGRYLTMAVNISAINLQDEGFPNRVAELLKEQEAEASWLELEITESAIMSNPVLAIANIKVLSEMGAQISIDDFGTGYSSMTYLKQLMVAKIKIDKSFVMEMATNKSDAVIVRSTIDLGHNLGMKVIAEGVEDAESWNQLKELGCDAAQGYFMSRPLSAEKFSEWLNHSPWAGAIVEPIDLLAQQAV